MVHSEDRGTPARILRPTSGGGLSTLRLRKVTRTVGPLHCSSPPEGGAPFHRARFLIPARNCAEDHLQRGQNGLPVFDSPRHKGPPAGKGRDLGPRLGQSMADRPDTSLRVGKWGRTA
jgi:hypothetical protein